MTLLRTPGMVPALTLVLLAFGGWSLLLPVVPLHVVRSGGGDVLAGAATGVFMGVTVATQLLTPRLLRRFGYRPVMLVGAALLGGPGALYLLHGGLVVLSVSAVRGAGFGLLTVAGSALVAELAPASQLGRATSMIGLGVGIAELVFLPTGLTLYEHYGLLWPAVGASAMAVIGVCVAAALPRVRPTTEPAHTTGEHEAAPIPERHGLALLGALWPAMAIMAGVAMCFGAISTYLPPTIDQAPGGGAPLSGFALAIVGGMVIIGRFMAGARADRHGPGGYIPIGMGAAAVGILAMGVLAVTGQNVWWFLVAAVIFGFGFGAIQNESLLGAFLHLPKSQLGSASAGWNIAFDGGTGLGALVLGLVAFGGYHWVFYLGAALCAALGVVAFVAWPREAVRASAGTDAATA